MLTVYGKHVQLAQQDEGDMTVFFNPDPNGQDEWAIRGSFSTAILSPQGLFDGALPLSGHGIRRL